jgi:hypothetical protein
MAKINMMADRVCSLATSDPHMPMIISSSRLGGHLEGTLARGRRQGIGLL